MKAYYFVVGRSPSAEPWLGVCASSPAGAVTRPETAIDCVTTLGRRTKPLTHTKHGHFASPGNDPFFLSSNYPCKRRVFGSVHRAIGMRFSFAFLWGSIIAEEKKEREGKVSRLFCDGLSGRVVVGRFA
jgi:hypothetical protein